MSYCSRQVQRSFGMLSVHFEGFTSQSQAPSVCHCSGQVQICAPLVQTSLEKPCIAFCALLVDTIAVLHFPMVPRATEKYQNAFQTLSVAIEVISVLQWFANHWRSSGMLFRHFLLQLQSYLCFVGLDQLKKALDFFFWPLCCNQSEILVSNGSNTIERVM